jgi:hypothetical protein
LGIEASNHASQRAAQTAEKQDLRKKLDDGRVLYQGTTSVVPQTLQNHRGL